MISRNQCNRRCELVVISSYGITTKKDIGCLMSIFFHFQNHSVTPEMFPSRLSSVDQLFIKENDTDELTLLDYSLSIHERTAPVI